MVGFKLTDVNESGHRVFVILLPVENSTFSKLRALRYFR